MKFLGRKSCSRSGAELRDGRNRGPHQLARAWWAIFRVRATLAAAAVAALGFADDPRVRFGETLRTTALASVSVVMLIAFTQVFNDIRDRYADAVAKPSRPIPSGAISVGQARIAAGICAVAGMVAAALMNVRMLALASAMLILGAAYSLWLKNSVLIGNAAMALLSSLAFLPSWVDSGSFSPVAFIGAGMVFFFIFGNELFKTTEDKVGDAATGITTIATAWGSSKAAACISCCWAAMTALVATAPVVLPSGVSFAVLTGILVCIPSGIGAFLAMKMASSKEHRIARAHLWWRASWLTGLACLLIYSFIK